MANPTYFDLVLISDDSELQKRVSQVADDYKFATKFFPSIDQLMELVGDGSIRVSFAILSLVTVTNKEEALGSVQVVRQLMPDCGMLVILGKKIDNSALDFMRKSGADVVLFEHELYGRSKLEFFAFQYIHSEFTTVKVSDFKAGTQTKFPVYCMLPANKKYLPILHSGLKIEAAKLNKLKDMGEVYVKRQNVEDYVNYLKTQNDQSADGLVSRCRGQFMALILSYVALVNHLTELTQSPSFDEGKKILEKCNTFSQDVLNSLMTVGDVWSIVNTAHESDFGSVDRGPSRSAIVGYLSMMGDIGKPEEVMLASLIADIGILDLAPETLRKLRAGKVNEMSESELKDYQQHPNRSLNYALGRKIQLSQDVKDQILLSHGSYTAAGKGFPIILNSEKFTNTCQLGRLAEIWDDRCKIRPGKVRPVPKEEFKKLVEEMKSSPIFSPSFYGKISKI